ncbi:MAG: hypothetical protein EBZ69_03130 [Alphaproteobacteria bacterium]|nr:hypothetical protein [Alphaproteobacteria bacterium]
MADRRWSGAPRPTPDDLKHFVAQVQAVAPQATSSAVVIVESGRAIVGAFMQALLLAVVVNALILWVFLRRWRLVGLTLLPLCLSGLFTLATLHLLSIPLNHANIIALPILLGVGISYAVYLVMGAAAGQTRLLTTPMARGVIFSGLTTLVAFGSLLLSSHPGTATMGLLLSLCLVYMLLLVLLVLPNLLLLASFRQDFRGK